MGRAPHYDRYRVKVSLRFLALTLISCILVAYAVGRTARLFLVLHPQLALLEEVMTLSSEAASSLTASGLRVLKLPTPVLPAGKILPQTTYTSKTFDTARSSINSRWVVTEAGKKQCVGSADTQACPATTTTTPREARDLHEGHSMAVAHHNDEEIHMPQGQHLLIDIENVDADFLNSEEQLASVMLEMVDECGLTLLSYHCHGLTPSGVSCAGVLLESHVSFHTWPTEGVITLDLFTCGDESLLPIVPLVERLFSVPRPGSKNKPHMLW